MDISVIRNNIVDIRNEKVILDSDLASLYEVETKHLKTQVKRNMSKFPDDFLFELTKEEKLEVTKCYHKPKIKASQYLPLAFTQYGVIQVASILKSEKAIKLSILIARAFVDLILGGKTNGLEKEVAVLRSQVKSNEKQIELLISMFKSLVEEDGEIKTSKNKIGFKSYS